MTVFGDLRVGKPVALVAAAAPAASVSNGTSGVGQGFDLVTLGSAGF
jgi:hypothetical protein